ncbi:Nucleoside-specific channel-forming protein Tsx [Halomonadaceae bacterium LMG 33818]|uniref:nucleoside-specific channel-forming protein Tsx n=1 Tax=Cernens ardua TaxID=3402176 RepID=UPI003EDBA714
MHIIHKVAAVTTVFMMSCTLLTPVEAAESQTNITCPTKTNSSASPAPGEPTPQTTACHATPASPYLSSWLTQHINMIGSHGIRFGPYPVNDTYLEYELMGDKGPWDLYGYFDAPRFFGLGNHADSGIFTKGSPLFWELEPRLSINKLTGLNLHFGPISQFYIAMDDIYDMGHNRAGRQHTMYIGLGTDIDTHTRASLSFNFYARRQFQNYEAPNENSWDGWRAGIKYFIPLTPLWGGNLSWIGFTNYDFNSKLSHEAPAIRSGTAIASSNALSLAYTHWAITVMGRYFHNGGNWKAGAKLGGTKLKTTGWGEYLILTYSF